MDPLNLKKLNAERAARRAALLLTDLGDGRDRLIREGDPVAGELSEAVAKAFRTGKSATFSSDGRDWFLNVHVPSPRIVVIGAVHISQALAPIAAIAGYKLEIIDPRTAFATPERFAGVQLAAEWPQEALKDRPLDAFTALAAVTHDPKIDDWPLAEAIRRGCFYVGALGSRKTHARRVERLMAAGLSAEEIARIHAPIGLDIGASSPQEIAVAVMAQVIAALRKRAVVAEAAAPTAQRADA
jgi:xanthine dehydrogenase accessory factor